MAAVFRGTVLSAGLAQGPLVVSDLPLSFWGGVDPATGIVIDRHHPLSGTRLAGRILAIPSGRGSCTGSAVLLETIRNGCAPAAIVVSEREEILTLGALVAAEFCVGGIPLLQVGREDFGLLSTFRHARVEGDALSVFELEPDGARRARAKAYAPLGRTIALEAFDEVLLAGAGGRAAQVAMRLVLAMAAIQGADRLVDVSQVHVDGCIYTGSASLAFAQQLVEWGARVRVPTTLNAISVDQRRWRALGIAEELGVPATALADSYVAMGARPTYTCAPYLLESAPGFGEQVGWAESNAVVYANSMLGARTMKYPDFLDICIALTGRAPAAGCHLDEGRRAVLALDVNWPDGADESAWPLLGYCCGLASGADIPLVRGLQATTPTPDDLKAFAAAFATTSAAPMVHIAGVTPEAGEQAPSLARRISRADLRRGWRELNSSRSRDIGLVSLGNPHASVEECARLADLVARRSKADGVEVVVTCGRDVHDRAARAGYVAAAEDFGVRFVTDTCWCMLGEPVVPPGTSVLMTNSGKYAHYAPGLVGRSVRFGSLADCVEAACTGRAPDGPPAWLGGDAA